MRCESPAARGALGAGVGLGLGLGLSFALKTSNVAKAIFGATGGVAGGVVGAWLGKRVVQNGTQREATPQEETPWWKAPEDELRALFTSGERAGLTDGEIAEIISDPERVELFLDIVDDEAAGRLCDGFLEGATPEHLTAFRGWLKTSPEFVEAALPKLQGLDGLVHCLQGEAHRAKLALLCGALYLLNPKVLDVERLMDAYEGEDKYNEVRDIFGSGHLMQLLKQEEVQLTFLVLSDEGAVKDLTKSGWDDIVRVLKEKAGPYLLEWLGNIVNGVGQSNRVYDSEESESIERPIPPYIPGPDGKWVNTTPKMLWRPCKASFSHLKKRLECQQPRT